MATAYKSGILSGVCIKPQEIHKQEIVWLNDKTMYEWYDEQADKPDYMINLSLWDNKGAIGTIVKGGNYVRNEGDGFGYGTASGRASFGKPWERKWDDYVTGYPALVVEGRKQTNKVDSYVENARSIRSVLAGAAGNLYLLTSTACTLDVLRNALVDAGFYYAINNDGGGSALILHNGEPVNRPTDTRRCPNCLAIWLNKKEETEIKTEEINTKYANPRNVGGKRTKPVEYIVMHYTGNKGDSAKNNAVYFAREAVSASAHYFVDEREIWQSVADDVIAWHCGGKLQGSDGHTFYQKCNNSNSIGVEMCLLDKSGALRKGTIDKAVPLVKNLMTKYGVDADHVIRHYDVTGKNCPTPMVADESLWRSFKLRLSSAEEVKDEVKDDIPDWAKATVKKLVDKKLIAGDGKNLNLSTDMLRVLVINDRAGLYD